MARLFIILTLAAGVFSALAFQQGGYLPGVVFALLAVGPPAWFITTVVRTRRNGGVVPAASSRSRTLGWIAVALIVPLTGYSVYWMFWMPKASRTALSEYRDLEKLCTGSDRKYFPDGAAHQGAGPHPIAIFYTDESETTQHASMGAATAPSYWSGDYKNPQNVQLVACLGSASKGAHVTKCEFKTDTLDQYQGIYNATLYETTTGKKVAETRLTGATTPNCPHFTMTKGKDPVLYTEPDFAEYQRALGKYVEN
ncbi:hypothetical protein LTV02_26805 [Nocardia yamanashiensis]|uniref:hypothetical protein n=1 Tax=Nocardia yamanashiensis TaxID=209247 RepID=UPI001E2F7CB0|nr:hypothetical protein [Nocardia yamanashiensis]UGT39652.1 hypothetical protein LTV02_26805 [Nocardia yamanashiensis]